MLLKLRLSRWLRKSLCKCGCLSCSKWRITFFITTTTQAQPQLLLCLTNLTNPTHFTPPTNPQKLSSSLRELHVLPNRKQQQKRKTFMNCVILLNSLYNLLEIAYSTKPSFPILSLAHKLLDITWFWTK